MPYKKRSNSLSGEKKKQNLHLSQKIIKLGSAFGAAIKILVKLMALLQCVDLSPGSLIQHSGDAVLLGNNVQLK